MNTICITGAAGNLGNLTAQHLLRHTSYNLNLMIHSSPLKFDASNDQRVKTIACDLGRKETLKSALAGVDQVIHYAGVLFKSGPEEFLPITNTQYFKNLIDAAKECGVKQVILISFPHVEGETSTQNPSTDRLDKEPISQHARTRLQEEKYLFDNYPNGISLRVGMVYGNGILMPDAAKWFARKYLLGVWKKPTQIHLISKVDYLEIIKSVTQNENARGVYNIGDDGVQTLQEYLDFACQVWGYKKPWRMPDNLIFTAAKIFEFVSSALNIKAPLTVDFVKIGMVSYYGDTTRMKKELLQTLTFPTMQDGKEIF